MASSGAFDLRKAYKGHALMAVQFVAAPFLYGLVIVMLRGGTEANSKARLGYLQTDRDS